MNAVDGACFFRDVFARVEAQRFRSLVAVWEHLDVAEFHDAILRDVQSGGFDVEEYDGSCEIQFHCYSFSIMGISNMMVFSFSG